MKIVDMHCDTISLILEKKRAGEQAALRENGGHLDLLRLQKSGYLLQNFALYVNCKRCEDAWEEVCSLYEVYREELAANEDILAPVLRFEDIAANQAAGKLSAMLTVEEGAVCKGNLRKLHELHRMGVRMLTLTWNYPNELGYPNLDSNVGKAVWKMCRELKEMKGNMEKTEEYGSMGKSEAALARQHQVQQAFNDYFYIPNETNGLTERGREFVTEMEHLGMIVDVSHLSDAGFYDVLECTRKPFVASHSNARTVCRSVRNLTDDMIRRLAERGGCTGLNYCADFLEEKPVGEKNPGTIEAIVRHAKHIVSMGGVEVLGLGSDFDGIDTHEELPGAQSMELLWEALHRAGFAQSTLDKIFRENVLRVYRDCLA